MPTLPIISRRKTIQGLAALAGMSVVAGADARQATPEASPSSGEWTYTDALGVTVTLPERPVRIAASLVEASALWDFGIKVVAVFDWTASAYPDGDHPAWGNIDVSSVANVGDVDGNIDLEALLVTEPDIILTLSFDPTSAEGTAGVLPDLAERIGQIAPVLVVTKGDATDIELARHESLALALGADLETPEIEESRATFEATVDRMTATIAEKPEISVLFANIDADALYAAGPAGVSELKYLASLGLTFANADSEAAGEFWEQLSLEQMLKYPSDVFFNDVYSTFKTVEELQAQPVVGEHPAIKAGQIGEWSRDFAVSYPGVTGFLETILAGLVGVEDVV